MNAITKAGAGRFEMCLKEVLEHEGGFVNHKADPGGATNLGITRKTLARWRCISPWWALPVDEVRRLGVPEAARIYRASYWDRCKAALMPAGLDLALFDFAVNSGPDRAIRMLQVELRVAVDGIVGPLTLAAIGRHKGAALGDLINALCDRRLGFLGRLATFATFGRGWTRRVAAIRAAALASAGGPFLTEPQPLEWSDTMTFLAGYRTYIVAAAMLVAGLAQLLGVDLPSMDGQSAGHLIMEALAIVFLRSGFKSEIGRT